MHSLIIPTGMGLFVSVLIVIGVKIAERMFRAKVFGFKFTGYMIVLFAGSWILAYGLYKLNNTTLPTFYWQYYLVISASMIIMAGIQRVYNLKR